MVRKIDYNLKARSQMIKRDLNRKNAIIDSIRQGKVTKAEILSGTELVPRDPIHQALITEGAKKDILKSRDLESKRDETNDLILTELRAIANRRYPDNLELLEDIRELLKTPRGDESIALPASAEPIVIDIDKGLSPDLVERYGKPSELYGNRARIEGIRDTLLDEIKSNNLGRTHRYETKELTKYRNRLKDVLRGMEVKEGKGIMTNMSDLSERLKLLVGSIESGNSNIELKNELADILHYLLKNKVINKSVYKTFMNLTT